MRYKAHTQ